MAEQHFRRALAISQGDLSVFYNPMTHPLAVGLLVIAIAFLLVPVFLRLRRA
jgi:putative tricarboxylic transport membrane protein